MFNTLKLLAKGFAFLLTFAFFAFPTQAGGLEKIHNPPPIPDAEKLIQECGDEYQPMLDTGITRKMRVGGYKIATCIKEHIIEQMVILIGEKEREEIETHLESIDLAISQIYWKIHNHPIGCFRDKYGRSTGWCGTMYQVMHNADLWEHYSEILRTVIRRREDLDW